MTNSIPNRKKIKVLHFMSGGEIGGQERAQFQIFLALKDDPDIDIGAAFSQESGYYLDMIRLLGIPVVDMRIRSGFNIIFKKNVLKQFREFDIHHLHDASPNIILYSLLAGKKIKRVFTRRGGIFDYQRYSFKKKTKFRTKKILLRRFDGFSGNSKNAVNSLINQYGIENEKVHLLYNGIDFSLLRPAEERMAVRQKLGLHDSDFVIGTACRLEYWKRVDLLIRAFANSEIPQKRLVIFGAGRDEKKLRKLGALLGQENRIIFSGEVKPIADYLQVLDCFVLASSAAESFGNALVEAMYLKLPSLIMEDSSGLREHLVDGETGFVARDETDLARKLEYVASHHSEVFIMTQRASAHVAEKYSFANMIKSIKDFYREVVEPE